MNADAPLALELRLVKGPGLAGRLLNHSAAARPVLHDLRLQPSRVILVTAAGDTLEPFDRRSLMKFDGTLFCQSFHLWRPERRSTWARLVSSAPTGAGHSPGGPSSTRISPRGAIPRASPGPAWPPTVRKPARPNPARPGRLAGTVASNAVEATLE